MKEKVLILFGGKSVEHDISIITALQTRQFLPKEYDFLPVYVDRNGVWWIAENAFDVKIYQNFHKLAKNKKRVSVVMGEKTLFVEKRGRFVKYANVKAVLNCCHGHFGEDGIAQGVFEACEIAQTSCKHASAALCMDKVFMKNVLEANRIPSPKYVYVNKCSYSENDVEKKAKKLGFPVVVKPANLGSSIGINVAKSASELKKSIDFALNFDKKVLIELYVKNLKEFNCACVKIQNELFVSSVAEVANKGEIFSFEDKYLSEKEKSVKVDANLSKKIKTLTGKVYTLFDCQGVVRVDFLYDTKDRVLYVNEVNSIPGALAFYLFKEIPFEDLLRCLIVEAIRSEDEDKSFVKTFESRALDLFEKLEFSAKK